MVSRADRGHHFIDQPYQPEDGYHFSKDIADKAVAFIRDGKQSRPDKPWYLWYCPGANHAPHHAPKEYIEKYKGKFDDGYEAYREWVLQRMIERGILPKETHLTPINPLPKGILPEADSVRPWNTLSEDEKKFFCRMAEVYAGFSEYTDVLPRSTATATVCREPRTRLPGRHAGFLRKPAESQTIQLGRSRRCTCSPCGN